MPEWAEGEGGPETSGRVRARTVGLGPGRLVSP
jgi:hypothetical protein